MSTAGLEARYYVRAALSVTDEKALHALVGAILRAPSTLPGLSPIESLLSRENRSLVAASALRGYAEHHDGSPSGVWHRCLSGVRVEVRYA